MWRFQTYGGLIGLIIYGMLAMNGVEFGRMQVGEIGVGIGVLTLAWVLFYIEPIMRKEKKNLEKKDSNKMSYRKNIFSSIGLLYLVAYLFEINYTNDIGFIIALSVILYVNNDKGKS